MPAELDEIVTDRFSAERDGSRCRLDEANQHPHRRRLSGSVWPEIARDCSGPQHKADVVDDRSPVKALDEMMRFEHSTLQSAAAVTLRVAEISRPRWRHSRAAKRG